MTKEIDQEKANEQMQPRLQALNLPTDRIFACKQLPLNEFMQLGELADIQLDSFPVTGGTTTYHALWMGLPVVSIKGYDSMSNSGSAILQLMGFTEWIADNTEAYIEKTLALANDIDTLKAHRASCRKKMQSSPLMNHKERTREIEKGLRLMWANHLLGEPRFLDSNNTLDALLNETNTA